MLNNRIKIVMKENLTAWLLLLPSFIFLGLFTFYPILKTIPLSLHRSNLGTPIPFYVGFGNFKSLMEDDVFWKVMRNTGYFVAVTVPVSILLSLCIALFVNSNIKGKAWIRTFFFYPTVIPAIAAASIWLFIYTPNYGLLNSVLKVLNIPTNNWLGKQETALAATTIVAIWKEAGFLMVFYLAGLQNISQELYEAAKVDGATGWFMFRGITLPLLMPTTLFVLIISATNAFKLIDHIVVMTGGGPDNATNLLLYYIYLNAFKFWDYGMAAALTVVMLIILVIIAVIQFFGLDKKIHYN